MQDKEIRRGGTTGEIREGLSDLLKSFGECEGVQVHGEVNEGRI